MKDSRFGKSAKNVSKSKMSTTALTEGKRYYDALMDAEYRGRRDRNGSARSRLAERLHVSENKLIRLEYKFEEMKDISGELYRALRNRYEALCLATEGMADRLEARRLGRNEHAAEKSSGAAAEGTVAGSD
jgi:hypothetical protein